MLVASANGFVNVALKSCPRCHGDGYWYEWRVDESNTEPRTNAFILSYQPYCNCTEEIRLAMVEETPCPK